MSNFDFVENKECLNVSVKGKSYLVTIAGQGIPCLMIGLGTLLIRTISNKFTSIFKIYSSDLYWIDRDDLAPTESFTMDTILEDINALADSLNLKQYIILAHSAFGIVALEFAKKYPNNVLGIIMIGTPLNSNQNIAKMHNDIFQREADENRKSIDAERRALIKKEDLTKLNASERWLREYVYRDAPRYWYIPDFDCAALWRDINLSKLLSQLFSDILPKTNVLNDIQKISTPIFLAAGLSDYDCCPWLWKNVENLPNNFTICTFEKSGHWPHYEEPELFDSKIKQWIEANL